jgi:hypothetical protein
MKNLLLLLLVLICGTELKAQLDAFAPSHLKSSDIATNERRTSPNQAAYFEVNDPSQLATALAKAPTEAGFVAGQELLLTLPNPDGQKSTFRITRYQMITNELQAVFPSFVTAYGWDVEAPYRKVFLEWTELGFGASITGGEEGRWYVAPTFWQRTDLYQSYYTKNYPARTDDTSCGFVDNEELRAELDALGVSNKFVGDCVLREYDLALACTGEYYAAVGGTEALVISEMMTAINRVNEVFRADLAITTKIINLPVSGGGVELVYSNAASDPYTNNDGAVMLGENQTEIDAVIGTANYDIGHVFSTGGGGIAALGSPCDVNQKAEGVTGLPNPTGDPFYIDFVAHEIGHQFGGNHTFNSTEGNCAARNTTTAYEPGGGTTIQAYAGICGATANIQQNSEAYYHAISIQEISAYMEAGGGSGCATSLSTSNTAPTVGAGTDYTIPTNTPFVLTAVNGMDTDFGDALTYCWEQFDLGSIVAGEPTGNETTGPLFRSKFPVSSPERYFPSLPSVVSGTTSWESLPLVARAMNFIVTVRDFGAAGYGCTVQDQTVVTVVNTGSQYAVTAPNGGETYTSGSTNTVTWDVAGTDMNGINCANVDILLSTDGGLTFTQTLATATPNDGMLDVTMPVATTSTARIMVRCSDNIFFDVSDTDFAIQATEFTLSGNVEEASICSGENTAVFTVDVGSSQNYTGSIDLSVTSGLPAGAAVAFSTDPVVFNAGNINTSQTVTVTVSNLAGAATGAYTIVVQANDGAQVETTNLSLDIGSGPLTLNTPADGSQQQIGADVDFAFLTVDGRNRYIVSYSLIRSGSTLGSGSFGTIYGGNPGNGLLTELAREVFAGSVIDGDIIEWFVTASDDNNVNADVVSCSRRYTLVSILPVNWLGFTARAAGKTALLSWSVEQDALNEGFAIERTQTNINTWQQVGYAPRTGLDGAANYQFTDTEVSAGNTYNYRLRQEGSDGSTSFSDIRTVAFDGAFELSVFPNPSNGFVTLNTGTSAQGNLQYTLYDPAGRKVSEGTISGGQIQINLNHLPAAIYQVLVTDGAAYREVVRVVKR